MRLSPLQLSSYQVMELSVAFRGEYDSEKAESNSICEGIETFLHIERDDSHVSEETSCWHVALRLNFDPADGDNSRYSFIAGIFGVFYCSNELPKGIDVETLVGINGTSILYGIARELVVTITEKGPWGALTLPTMSFTDFRSMLEKESPQEPAPETESKS